MRQAQRILAVSFFMAVFTVTPEVAPAQVAGSDAQAARSAELIQQARSWLSVVVPELRQTGPLPPDDPSLVYELQAFLESLGTDAAQPGAVGATGGQPQPPTALPTFSNRPPNAPSVHPGGFDPPITTAYGAVQLAWTNNGDPDGDSLTFGVYIMEYDWASQAWVPVPSFRDVYGNTNAVWTREPVYTFTTQAGLRPGAQYSWIVIACEVDRGPAQQCAWSGWSAFATQ